MSQQNDDIALWHEVNRTIITPESSGQRRVN